MYFYLAVYSYAELVFLVKIYTTKRPEKGDEVLVDFHDERTEFVCGSWGKGSAVGTFGFPVTSTSTNTLMGDVELVLLKNIPIFECQLAYLDVD